MNVTRTWMILGVAVGVLLSAYFLTAANTSMANGQSTALAAYPLAQIPTLTPDPQSSLLWLPLLVMQLPQYPEFTLEQQQAAMQRIEQMRRETRVEGLREQIPPADWIEIAYHGLVLDANYDVIEMDFDTVSRIQVSLFEILYEPTRDEAIRVYGVDLKDLFYNQQYQAKEQLVIRSAALDAMVAVADQALQDRYSGRNGLLHGAANALIDWSQFVIHPSLYELLRGYNFRDIWIVPPPPSSAYVQSCRAEDVPIPPDWPDPRWRSQGPLAFVLISSMTDEPIPQRLTAEVYAYKDPSVPGVCYALPRRTDTGSIRLLGIICQSQTSGKACFWDNKTTGNAPLIDVPLDIDRIGDGSTLNENCTACHRGDNAFVIHPGTALEISRDGRPGGPYVTDLGLDALGRRRRYTPIGQAQWSNPGPLVLPALPIGQESCNNCHGLPLTTSPPGVRANYCRDILRTAATTTMPPLPPGSFPAGWPPNITNPLYSGHISYLSRCP